MKNIKNIKNLILKKEQKFFAQEISEKYNVDLDTAEKICKSLESENKFIQKEILIKCEYCLDYSLIDDKCEHCNNFINPSGIHLIYYINNNLI